jgi:Na+/proline symporter
VRRLPPQLHVQTHADCRAWAWVAFLRGSAGRLLLAVYSETDADDVHSPLQLLLHSLPQFLLANMRSAVVFLAALATAVSAASLQARQNFPPW